MRESPRSLKLAALGSPLALFAPAVSYAPTGPYVESLLVVVALFGFVLAGSRIAWVLAVVLMAAAALGTALNGVWWEVPVRLLLLILLLLPSSRGFVWQGRQNSRVSAPSP
ncbi:MAG TPA: hypothetical protein VGF09_09145 [Solirubrobacterales bacterium]|jgi:hypothetical protein